MKIPVGVSNRHVHLKEETLKILFGDNYVLNKRNELKQPGEFASSETLTIKTEKAEIPNVRVLGPIRKYDQVEISKTDSYKLGINPPVKNSGDLEGASTITLIGPVGTVTVNACIIPNRHIHISDEKALELGFTNNQMVSVKVFGIKGGILDNVYIKIQPNAYFEIHLDTDDANAHLLKEGDIVEII